MCKKLTKFGYWVRQWLICRFRSQDDFGFQIWCPLSHGQVLHEAEVKQGCGGQQPRKSRRSPGPPPPLWQLWSYFCPFSIPFFQNTKGWQHYIWKSPLGWEQSVYFVLSELGHQMLSEASACGPDLVPPSGKCRSTASWWDLGSGKPWDEISHISRTPESQHDAHTHFCLVLNNLGLLLPDKLN